VPALAPHGNPDTPPRRQGAAADKRPPAARPLCRHRHPRCRYPAPVISILSAV